MEYQAPTDDKLTGLQQAFEAFNEVSGLLQHSYEGLQQQVVRLEQELHLANTERAEEARRNRELAKRLTALLEALPGAVVMLDEHGTVRDINSAAHDFLGEPLQDLEWTLVCRRAFRHDSIDHNGDLTLQDGRQVSLAQKPMVPGPGRVLLLTDVSETRKIQELLARHQRLAAMGEMAAALAHQIRTPLSAALLYMTNAARRDLGAEHRLELLNSATVCLQDLEQLISDMLQFARGAGQSDEHFELVQLLESLELALAPMADTGSQVRISAAARPLTLTGNKDALVSAILNIASNALQAAGPDGCVKIDTAITPLQLEISVIDNGPGVPADMREKIFESFYTSRPDGTGLGLAVARSIVRAHGGDIMLLDEDGGGARFVIRLPLAAPSTNRPDSAREDMPAAATDTTEEAAA